MRTRSGKVYDPVEPNTDMDPNTFSSIISPTYYMTLEILKTLEKIKTQMNTLGQRMDRLEVDNMIELVMESIKSIIAEKRESIWITIDTMRMNGT